MSIILNGVPDGPDGEALERAWYAWTDALAKQDPPVSDATLRVLERKVDRAIRRCKLLAELEAIRPDPGEPDSLPA